jgi:hypothetical protein
MTTPPGPTALQLLAEALSGGAPWPELLPVPALEPGTTSGQRARQLREAARLTPGELARACGTTEPAITSHEYDSSPGTSLRRVIARGLAAMDNRHNPAELAAELLSLPPKPRPEHRSDRREARAAEQAIPPEVVNVSRAHRLQWEAARAEAEAAEASR